MSQVVLNIIFEYWSPSKEIAYNKRQADCFRYIRHRVTGECLPLMFLLPECLQAGHWYGKRMYLHFAIECFGDDVRDDIYRPNFTSRDRIREGFQGINECGRNNDARLRQYQRQFKQVREVLQLGNLYYQEMYEHFTEFI